MWRWMSSWLRRISVGWVALSALVVFLLFSIFVLPSQANKPEAGARGAGSPDLSLYYTADELYQMAEAYGEWGRQAYVRARLTFDVVWPLVYVAFLGSAISWVYGRAFPAGSKWQIANLAPVVGGLLDFLENLSTSLVMLRFPSRTPIVDVLAPLFTLFKWVLLAGSMGLLLIGVAVGLAVAIGPWIKSMGSD